MKRTFPEGTLVKPDEPGKCNHTIAIGDNECTMKCELPAGHDGQHLEEFTLYERSVRTYWDKRPEDDKPKPSTPEPDNGNGWIVLTYEGIECDRQRVRIHEDGSFTMVDTSQMITLCHGAKLVPD